MVWIASASPAAFAQTQVRVQVQDEIETAQEPLVPTDFIILSSTKEAGHVSDADSRADCSAGQVVQPGERCTYPGTNFEFVVDSSGNSALRGGGVNLQAGRGGRQNWRNLTLGGGVRINFVAQGRPDGSWFLEEVAGDSAAEPSGSLTSGYPEITLAYDTGRNPDRLFTLGADDEVFAQRYDVPSGARLASVLAAPIYHNRLQNSGVPDNAPDDFNVRIWDVGADGLPGNELYSMHVVEPSDRSEAVHYMTSDNTYVFLQVDFPEDDETFTDLPDRIFIGLANAGSDINYLSVATSPRKDTAPADAAYWRTLRLGAVQWISLADIVDSNGERPFLDRVFPFRPVFRTPSDSAFEETILSYDSGRNDDSIWLTGALGNIAAQRYDVPPASRLASVSVAPIYDNQFGNSSVPAGAPRNFSIKIWDVGADGSPGDELYSIDVEREPYESHRLSDNGYLFAHVDLPSDEAVLSALPDRIFIGLANAGTDQNYLSPSTSLRKSDAPTDAAYLLTDNNLGVFRWASLSTIMLSTGRSLSDQAFPIRPRFLASSVVAAEDAPELPSAAELAQNYPNPFNPATSISWTQPATGEVRLSVYNLLGQRVAIPADGLYPAGGHEVRLDASGWPSGVYTYVLETETRMLARSMVLLK